MAGKVDRNGSKTMSEAEQRVHDSGFAAEIQAAHARAAARERAMRQPQGRSGC